GALEGVYDMQATGERRDLMIDLLSIKQDQRERALARLMSWLCPGAVVQGQDVKVPPEPQSPATASIRFTVPRFTIRAGAREVISPYLVRFRDLTDAAASPTRSVPLLFSHLFSDTSEVQLRLPPGRSLKSAPSDQTHNGPGLLASTHFELSRQDDRP